MRTNQHNEFTYSDDFRAILFIVGAGQPCTYNNNGNNNNNENDDDYKMYFILSR